MQPRSTLIARSVRWTLVAASLAAFVGCPHRREVEAAGKTTTLYFVRHAEKQKGSSGNPPLTAAGRSRAAALVSAMSRHHVDVVYASHLRRTQETVAPLAKARGLTVQVRHANHVERLINEIRREHAGKSVLVAGHSDTLPLMLKKVGAGEVTIRNSDYGDIFVVTLRGGRARLAREHFGP